MYVAVLLMQECQDLRSDSDVGRHRKTTNSTVRRQPKTCPLKHCQKSVVNIPRHLRTVHKWSDSDAKFAVGTLGLRSAYRFVDVPKFKDYHCHRKCPIDGCLAVCKRIGQHLKDAHRILPHTILYKKTDAKC